MASKYLAWRDGQTYGVIAYDASQYTRGAIVVTNDGERWAAVLKPYPITTAMAPELMPSYVQLLRIRSLANAEPEFRLPVEWAKQTVVEPGRIYTTAAGKFADTKVVEYTSPATKHLGSVSYTGFEKVAKKSGHSLESIHRAVNSAVARAIEVWNFACIGLEVKFHESGRAFGLAYEPGTGAYSNVRKISLNALLLQTYDLNSIARVVIHELCHHFREERYPREFRGDPHDAKFCEALTKADPEIAGSEGARSTNANRCITFADIPDTALEAARKAKVEARTTQPTWAPEAGVLVHYILKSGQLRMLWEPLPGFKWSQWVRSLNDSNLLELMKHFGPHDWTLVTVRVEPRIARMNETTMNLRDWIRWITEKYAKYAPKTIAYLKEVSS